MTFEKSPIKIFWPVKYIREYIFFKMRKKKILSRKAEKILRRSYNLAITAVIVIILLIYKARAYPKFVLGIRAYYWSKCGLPAPSSNHGAPSSGHFVNKSL